MVNLRMTVKIDFKKIGLAIKGQSKFGSDFKSTTYEVNTYHVDVLSKVLSENN
jgi:hypothetical protein